MPKRLEKLRTLPSELSPETLSPVCPGDSCSAMDHIPDLGPNIIRVPLLDGDGWDNGDFCTYDKPHEHHENQELPGPMEKMVFVQTWLFFGLLTEVFKLGAIQLEQNDFINNDEQGRQIVTRILPLYLVELLSFERSQPSGKSERCETVTKYLGKLKDIAETYWEYGDESRCVAGRDFVREVGGPVLLSISLVSRALDEACTAFYGKDFISGCGVVKNMLGARFLLDTMKSEGWCASQPNQLARMGGRELLYLGYTYKLSVTEGSDHSHYLE